MCVDATIAPAFLSHNSCAGATVAPDFTAISESTMFAGTAWPLCCPVGAAVALNDVPQHQSRVLAYDFQSDFHVFCTALLFGFPQSPFLQVTLGSHLHLAAVSVRRFCRQVQPLHLFRIDLASPSRFVSVHDSAMHRYIGGKAAGDLSNWTRAGCRYLPCSLRGRHRWNVPIEPISIGLVATNGWSDISRKSLRVLVWAIAGREGQSVPPCVRLVHRLHRGGYVYGRRRKLVRACRRGSDPEELCGYRDMAKGPHAVDNLKTSAHLGEVAERNVKGIINASESAEIVAEHYGQEACRFEDVGTRRRTSSPPGSRPCLTAAPTRIGPLC